MKNRSRPFFYEKKRTSFGKIFIYLILSICLITIIGMQIPGIRRIISEPVFAVCSFVWNAAKDFFSMTRKYHEPEIIRKTYTPLELPDQQVLFAESLENLSAITQEDPLAELRQTPTPSEYNRVAEWEYLDPNLNYDVSSAEKNSDIEMTVSLIPPVFEQADLYNDGAAILSACLRYWGIIENQYQIAKVIHPNSFDPFTSFDELGAYISTFYPEYMVLRRINGEKKILIEILNREIPVILPVQENYPYPFWPSDDRFGCKYWMILGYDSQKQSFLYQNTYGSNTLEINEDELLSLWYPFQREYMVIYPESKDTEIREAVSENYFEELNLQKALSKFKLDSELLPDNPFAQYNAGAVLHRDGDNGGAWEFFLKALEIMLPQRFVLYEQDILQTALELGYADDLDALLTYPLSRNSNDETLTLYRGWASILRGDNKNGAEFFEKAGKINPNNNKVIYALKYKETMLNY